MKKLITLFALLLLLTPSKGNNKNDSSLIQEISDIKFKEAEYYLYKKEYQRAIMLFKEVTTLNKADLEVFYRLGVCYYKSNDSIEADKYFEQAAIDIKIRTKIQMFKRMNSTDADSNWW